MRWRFPKLSLVVRRKKESQLPAVFELPLVSEALQIEDHQPPCWYPSVEAHLSSNPKWENVPKQFKFPPQKSFTLACSPLPWLDYRLKHIANHTCNKQQTALLQSATKKRIFKFPDTQWLLKMLFIWNIVISFLKFLKNLSLIKLYYQRGLYLSQVIVFDTNTDFSTFWKISLSGLWFAYIKICCKKQF